MNPNFWFNMFVLAVGWPVVMALSRRQTLSLRMAGLCALAILAGAWGYTNFLTKHGPNYGKGEWYHHSEMWQYYLGSKYYKELRNTGLYDATLTALKEQEIPRQQHPTLKGARDLQRVFKVIPEEEAIRRFESEGKSQFTPARWTNFLTDVRKFYEESGGKTMMVLDMGYNPPPPYSLLVGMISNAIPISNVTLNLMASFDWILITLCVWILFRTFGPASAMAFALVFLTNPLSNWGWVGGAYLRNLEITLVTFSICMMHRHRMLASGALLGLATSIRVFPVAFFLGALIPFVGKLKGISLFKNPKSALFNLLAGFFAVCLVAFSATTMIYGWDHWHGFFSKILLHSKILFVYHVGFDKLVMPLGENAPQYFDTASSSGLMLKFQNWLVYNTEIYNQEWLLYGVVKMVIWTLAVLISTRLSPANATLLVGELSIFLFSLPANYYYMTLALFAAAPFLTLENKKRESGEFAKWLPLLALLGLNLVDGFWRDSIHINVAHNWIIFGWLILYMATCLPRPLRSLRKSVLSATPVLATLILVVAFIAVRPREFPSTNSEFPENIFAPHENWKVTNADAWTQHLETASDWTTKKQLLARVTDKSEFRIIVNVPVSGIYRVYLDYTTAPDYMDILHIKIGRYKYGVRVNTPNVMHKTWESPPTELESGPFEIVLTSKPSSTSGNLLGVSSLYIVPD